ncbi:LysR family transcriptional regulator [Sodalis praecaptivus]|uniref:LysR family transcriptional regulator n=1 Tax=Sodalis praecaptivus TaxID=1239307 RepID=W0HY04_9GAMM|nr:LysR family transcriptional regulator [Sodalis praecaptivus]AHF77023.1 LysR family transcriptional regulator [Sodalis praecaptivus]
MNISDNLDPVLLRVFITVCQYGSMSRAATELGRTQSALSIQIIRLEELLGVRLLHRTGRGVRPTPEGEMFLSYARRLLTLADEAVNQLQGWSDTTAISIGIPENHAATVFPEVLNRLRRLSPGMHVRVAVDYDERVARGWENGNFDIAIGATQFFSAQPEKSWLSQLHWVCSPDFIPDLNQPLALVVYGETCFMRKIMLQALTGADIEYKIVVTSSNMGVITAAVESGMGIALVAPDIFRQSTMKKVNLPVPDLTISYGMYVAPHRTTAFRRILEILDSFFY